MKKLLTGILTGAILLTPGKLHEHNIETINPKIVKEYKLKKEELKKKQEKKQNSLEFLKKYFKEKLQEPKTLYNETEFEKKLHYIYYNIDFDKLKGFRKYHERNKILKPLFEYMSKKYKIPLNILEGIADTETKFDPTIKHINGQGLMQITSIVIKDIPRLQKLGYFKNIKKLENINLNDPYINLEIAANYLDYLIQKTNGNVKEIIMRYNAGPFINFRKNPEIYKRAKYYYKSVVNYIINKRKEKIAKN